MTNGNHAAQSKHLESLVTAAKRYVLNEVLDVSEAVAAEIESINDVELIEGTQTASTGAWTGVTKDSSLKKGKLIIYKLPYAGSGNATLNLTLSTGTKTGAKNVYRYGSTRLKTEYGANYYIPLIFNGTYWFALADYDVNYYDRTRIANAIAVASGAVQAVCFVGSTDGTNYKQLSSGATFDINYHVFYNATATADNANMSTGLYFAIGSVNLQTLVGDTNRTFDAQKPLYLKGTLNGNIFTVHSDIITTTIPTTEDGYTYLFVGHTYSTYQAYIMRFENKFFAYKDSAFREIELFALKALQDKRGQQIDSTYVKNISSSNGVMTVTKGDDSFATLQGGGSGDEIVLGTVPSTVDGGIWYEVENSEPVVKIYYGGHDFVLTPTIVPISPQLTLSQSTVTGNPSASFVVDVSYLGNGTISISQNNNIGSATYNSSTKKISISPTYATADGTTVFTINLSAAHGYTAASATLTATWQATTEPEPIGEEPFIYEYNGESYSGSQEFPVPGEEVVLTFTNAPPDIQISAVDEKDNPFEDFTFESGTGYLIFTCEAPLTFTFAADGHETATITFVRE